MRNSLITPEEEEGISIEALSDSTVTRLCSALILSPTLTRTSMTSTSLKSPMSGTRTSTGPALETGAAAAGATLVTGEGAGAATGTAAVAPASSSRTILPSATLSPILTLTSFTTPAVLEGISIEALSDSTVIKLCSGLIVSPALTSTSITSTSLKSPMSGTLTSTRLMLSCLRKAAIRP